MENSITVGYSLGMVEGYLEGRANQGDDGAATVLEHFKNVERAYIEKSQLLLKAEEKLSNISLNLNGWSQN